MDGMGNAENPGLGQVPAVTRAALDAGHEPSIERSGKRFRIVCSCGWKTQTNWSRKYSFLAVSQHVHEAGKAGLEKDTPERVNVPSAVGGRC